MQSVPEYVPYIYAMQRRARIVCNSEIANNKNIASTDKIEIYCIEYGCRLHNVHTSKMKLHVKTKSV